jgi:hypothetical protein
MRLVGGNPMKRPIEAQVIDSRHLKLKNPIQIPPGSKVMITIEPADVIAEDQAWYALSVQTLLASYGDDEPDYSLEM